MAPAPTLNSSHYGLTNFRISRIQLRSIIRENYCANGTGETRRNWNGFLINNSPPPQTSHLHTRLVTLALTYNDWILDTIYPVPSHDGFKVDWIISGRLPNIILSASPVQSVEREKRQQLSSHPSDGPLPPKWDWVPQFTPTFARIPFVRCCLSRHDAGANRPPL